MSRQSRRARSLWIPAAALLALTAAVSCAHAPLNDHSLEFSAPAADSATIGLWRMDEVGGTRAEDAGRLHLDATAGQETRTAFGRFGSARVFSRSIESFLFVPYTPEMESPLGLTVEAWIYPNSFTNYEDSPIACRWTERADEQSWLLTLIGRKIALIPPAPECPQYHRALTALGQYGHLMFALQPAEPGLPQAYFSASQIELNRWTHVAATYDGEVVRLYVDDQLDAQYVISGGIRESQAPLLVGNYFDPSALTDFGGIFRVGSTLDRTPYYAYAGLIDELRISRTAREPTQ